MQNEVSVLNVSRNIKTHIEVGPPEKKKKKKTAYFSVQTL